MKKIRLVSLLLCLLMVVGVFFTSCSNKEDEEALEGITDAASESTLTLAVHLMSETDLYVEQTDEEGNTFTEAQRIEDAVNKITKSQFKVQLKLFFHEADEYYDVLEAKFAARKAAEDSGEVYVQETQAASGDETAEETEAETIVGDDGIAELVYPTIKDYQVDIFYLAGYEKFAEYKAGGKLLNMGQYLTNKAMLLQDYIAPGFFTYMNEMNNGTFALPTGKVIGEYTYMLLNKEVLEETNYYSPNASFNSTGFTALTDDNVADILEYTSKYMSDKYVPLYSETKELDVLGYKYWGVDANGKLSDDFSVMGGNYDLTLKYKDKGAYSTPANLLANEEFKADVLQLKEYVNNGYYGTEEDADKPFAVGYVKGGAELAEKYAEDYIMVPVALPELETEDIYENMFAVTYYTTDAARSMEILTYLNTNVAIRNLLLYGIEGENYELVNSKYKDAKGEVYLDENEKPYQVVSEIEGNQYKMDKFKTGNTLIVTPTVDDLPIIKEYATKQNRESVISQDMTFMLTDVGELGKLDDIRELSADVYEDLMAIMNDSEKAVEDLAKFIDDTAAEIDADESFAFHVSEDNVGSFAAVYKTWCKSKGVLPTE
ncbi:MAG: hypothetical protein IKL59_00715 [Clostridia bacterium]|nr:hypothetical protein [Clostridia bacterium]